MYKSFNNLKHNFEMLHYWKQLNHIILNKQKVVVLLYFEPFKKFKQCTYIYTIV